MREIGGNSKWRGPIWMPVNALIIRGLLQYDAYYGNEFTVECPTGSGRQMNLYQINTRVWMTEFARKLGRPATLDDVPNAELDRLAQMGFDWVWFLSVWQTGPAGQRVSRNHLEWRSEFQETYRGDGGSLTAGAAKLYSIEGVIGRLNFGVWPGPLLLRMARHAATQLRHPGHTGSHDRVTSAFRSPTSEAEGGGCVIFWATLSTSTMAATFNPAGFIWMCLRGMATFLKSSRFDHARHRFTTFDVKSEAMWDPESRIEKKMVQFLISSAGL